MVRSLVVLVLFAGTAGMAAAADAVKVPGSNIAFASKVQQKAQGQLVDLQITGTALRTKTIFNVKVYSLASYAQNLSGIKTPEDLAAAEQVKLLHFVMERKVEGSEFIGAFRDAIGASRTDREFASEFAQLKQAVGNAIAEKGDYVLLLYVPNVGTRIMIGEQVDATIPGAAFGKAVWEIYLGKNPVDPEMKTNLTRLLQ